MSLTDTPGTGQMTIAVLMTQLWSGVEDVQVLAVYVLPVMDSVSLVPALLPLLP